jgi:hypothetical protein
MRENAIQDHKNSLLSSQDSGQTELKLSEFAMKSIEFSRISQNSSSHGMDAIQRSQERPVCRQRRRYHSEMAVLVGAYGGGAQDPGKCTPSGLGS